MRGDYGGVDDGADDDDGAKGDLRGDCGGVDDGDGDATDGDGSGCVYNGESGGEDGDCGGEDGDCDGDDCIGDGDYNDRANSGGGGVGVGDRCCEVTMGGDGSRYRYILVLLRCVAWRRLRWRY